MSGIKHLIADLQSRKDADHSTVHKVAAERMVARLFKQQADFVLDKSRHKSALCPRRAGKTYACLTMICRTALLFPRANVLYLCLTRGQAKRNIWNTFKEFNDDFELGCKFHETNLIVTFPNGSIVTLAGAETSSEVDKLRGQALDLAVIDEGKSFAAEILKELIQEVIKPALLDRRGQLAMIGTPGNVLLGPFYEVTTTEKPHSKAPRVRPFFDKESFKGPYIWSFHKWHVRDNTPMPQIWEGALADKEANDWDDDDPVWLREYMGEWCASDSLTVYAYSDTKNPYDGALPEGHDWKYILGLDIGFEDSTAVVVAAYSDTHPNLYHVYDSKKPHLDVPLVAKEVKKAIKIFGTPVAMVADTGGLGKMIVETLASHHELYFEVAEKREKHDHIELLNSDLRRGHIKVLEGSSLQAEMRMLQWSGPNKQHEDPKLENHACDAFLYLWRYAYHHLWRPKQQRALPGTKEWYEEWEQSSIQKLIERRNNTKKVIDVIPSVLLDGEWT